ncbi:MAG: DHH family phosphoesterase [Saprospiraceae bacterium]|nr:DHH family phosphoesterase [Saprospiraceae bacterium]
MTLEASQIKEYLAQPRVIGLFSHRNPDGDALGSTLAMQHLLVQMGHTAKVMVPSEYPQNFEWMPGVDKILVWDLDSEDIKAYTNTMDFAIYLDFNSLDRIDKMGEYISNKTIKTWTIDHHIDPIIISDWIYSVPEASSTSNWFGI